MTYTDQIQMTFHTYKDMSTITIAIQHYAHLYLSRGKTHHIC